MLAKFSENNDETNIETNTRDARGTIENIALDPNETIISIDVNKLYIDVSLKEAIEVSLQKLYSQESPPEIQRATIKSLEYRSAKIISSVITNDTRKLMV